MSDLLVVRTEKKYDLSQLHVGQLMKLLDAVMKRDEHSEEDGYMVRSLYFDSIYDDDYFDKVDGIEIRKKIRLRIYSTQQETAKLELKQKQESAQKKVSITIPRSLAEEMTHGNYLGLAELQSENALMFYHLLETGLYRPSCIIEYQRTAFTEQTNDIRITFDRDIEMSPFCERFFDDQLSLIPVRKDPVLEVKYNRFMFSTIKQVLNCADAPELAISKYAMARAMLGM